MTEIDNILNFPGKLESDLARLKYNIEESNNIISLSKIIS